MFNAWTLDHDQHRILRKYLPISENVCWYKTLAVLVIIVEPCWNLRLQSD